VRAAEQIAALATSAGISVSLQLADFDTTIRAMTAPPYDFDMLLAGWTNGMGDPAFADYRYYDPDDFALFHSSQITQGVTDTRAVQNIVGFRDSSYDNQAAAARQLYEFDARLRAQTQAQGRVAALHPYIFLWADRLPVVLAPQITSLDGPIDLATPMYLNTIERWYIRR
jgi:peptide/nickel transport system substrate-binding protein